MRKSHPVIGRRDLITAAAGLGAGLLAGGETAQAQTRPQTLSQDVWTGEYWAKKGDVSLSLFRKRVGAPQPGAPALPVLFLVHGSSNSARSSFDLSVPGRGEYSLMNVFARYGFDVWTMDHENYGRSSRTQSNSDIASGVEDLKVGAELVVRETGRERLHFAGTSSGALRAAGYAMERPDRVDRLVLSAFTYTGKDSPTLKKRAEQVEAYRASNRRKRDRAMIRSIFTRDEHGAYDPAVAEALAEAELQFGDETPTGTYLDMVTKLPVVDPTRVKAPVLLIRGEFDGIATLDDLFAFYKQLPNRERYLVELPNVAHSIGFANNRHLYWHAMHAFLTAPRAEA